MQKLEGRLQTTVRKRGHYKSKNGQKTEQHHIWRSDAGGAKLKGEAKDLSDLCASNPVVKINALAGVMVPLKHQLSNINRISNEEWVSMQWCTRKCHFDICWSILIYFDAILYYKNKWATQGARKRFGDPLQNSSNLHQLGKDQRWSESLPRWDLDRHCTLSAHFLTGLFSCLEIKK